VTDEHGSSDPARIALALLASAALIGPAAAVAKPAGDPAAAAAKPADRSAPEAKAERGRNAARGPRHHGPRAPAAADPSRAARGGDGAGGADRGGHGSKGNGSGRGNRGSGGAGRGAGSRGGGATPAGGGPRGGAGSRGGGATPAGGAGGSSGPRPDGGRRFPDLAGPSPDPAGALPAALPSALPNAGADTRPAGAAPGSVLRATLRGEPLAAPPLTPIPQLTEQRAEPGPGRPAAAIVERPRPRREPSLPFSGFSLLALVLSGAAAIATGRRLHELTAPAPLPQPPPRAATVPDRPSTRWSGHAGGRESRAAAYAGAALIGLAVLAVARGRYA
jgi:hypothetical protein